jgi:hypothetical protein
MTDHDGLGHWSYDFRDYARLAAATGVWHPALAHAGTA